VSAEHIDVEVGRRVRAARKQSRLTQQQVLRALENFGWSTGSTSLTHIEGGTRSVRVRELDMIARALEVPLATLIPRAGATDEYAAGYRAGVAAVIEAAEAVSR